MSLKALAAATCLSLTFATAASAIVLLDYSPETTGISDLFPANNISTSQNFGTRISLTDDYNLTAIDRWVQPGGSEVGMAVALKVWTSDGATLLYNVASTLSVQDSDGVGSSETVRGRADLDLDLAAGSYLIGISGVGSELGQGVLDGHFGETTMFRDNVAIGATTTASIRVFGELAAVPLPAGLPLMFSALALVGFAARRRAS